MKKVLPLLLILSVALNAWQLTKNSSATGKASDDQKSSRSANSLEQVSLSDRRAPIKEGNTKSPETASYSSLDEVLAIGDPLQRYEALLAFIKNLDPNEIEGYLEPFDPAKERWTAKQVCSGVFSSPGGRRKIRMPR